MSSHSQFGLLTQRRFLPFFLSQSLGAFNDNVFKQGLVALVVFVGAIDVGMSSATFSLLAGALFILPYFLFSALGGQLADKYEKSRLIRYIKDHRAGDGFQRRRDQWMLAGGGDPLGFLAPFALAQGFGIGFRFRDLPVEAGLVI